MADIRYAPPGFSTLSSAPNAVFTPAPSDGVLPDRFFCTSNLPTYVKHQGQWTMPLTPRMDGCLVLRNNQLFTLEPRLVKQNEPIAIGEAEDGSNGILVHSTGFNTGHAGESGFRFMSTEVSRERPVNYESIAQSLLDERTHHGHVVWVLGPAVVHSRARADIAWMIEKGFVHAVLAGNAVAVHDLEAALYGTTLGMTDQGEPAPSGHGLHMRAINRIRQIGSIEKAVGSDLVKTGIMYALHKNHIPYVLAGSLRDDGPLPGVITDNIAAQDAMRLHTSKATGAVLIASALHSIAVGNQLPSFHTQRAGEIRPMFTVCVDQTEFVVNKLKDRGTQQAYGVVTNAQDFVQVLRVYLERMGA